jgi:lipopolysaccharide biosynthesis glycosyltransferase
MDACWHPDQSALNVVAASDRFPLSIMWNFQTTYYQWLPSTVAAQARLYHSAGFPKPWMAYFPPLTSFYSHYIKSANTLSQFCVRPTKVSIKTTGKKWFEHFEKVAFLHTFGRSKLTERRVKIDSYVMNEVANSDWVRCPDGLTNVSLKFEFQVATGAA